jgi:hypothetical protein
MTVVVSEIYCAFKEANVSNETARRADEAIQALAGNDHQRRVSSIPLSTLIWMTGANAAMTLAVLLKLFIH